jgi:EAL and modified HD-GYP domain-containing signal transduction protein
MDNICSNKLKVLNMAVLIGRQPIICRSAEIIGYELLYRDSFKNAYIPTLKCDATERLIKTNGLVHGVKHITHGKKAMINFSEEALLQGLAKRLPASDVVIEILETVRPTDEVFTVCCELKMLGYELALDDFIYNDKWMRFLKLVQIVKIDIIETPLDTLSTVLEKIKNIRSGAQSLRPKLLAEKIETIVEYEQAKSLGFDYFQGYLFGKPEIVTAEYKGLKIA